MSRIIESCMACGHRGISGGNKIMCYYNVIKPMDLSNVMVATIPDFCPLPSLDDKLREAWEACFIATEHGDTCDTIQVTITFDEWRNQNEH